MTPSGDHYAIASEFIENNVHVICDKPLTATLEDGYRFTKISKRKKYNFCSYS